MFILVYMVNVSPIEKWFAILAELVGTIIFALLMGSLASIFSAQPLDRKVQEQMAELRE